MNSILKFIFIAVLIFACKVAAQEAQRVYMGVTKCKTCHKKPDHGKQYLIWKETRHAKAFETLATDKALEYGKERGVENPQTSPKCLKCHVTAFNVDEEFLGKKYKAEDGIGCETCHGPGGDYFKKKTMTGITSGKIDPASVGLKKPKAEDCTKCHNDESPAFKGFNYEEALKIIAHPIPDSTKAKLKNK